MPSTRSRKIDYAVLLALDGVYKNGKVVESESHLVTPNDYIMKIAGGEPARALRGLCPSLSEEERDAG